MLAPDDPVTAITGIGPAKAKALGQLGIATVRDLIEHYPRRHADLGAISSVEDAPIGDPVTLMGTITSWEQRRARAKGGRRLDIATATVRDRDGAYFTATFFNQSWRENQLPAGTFASFSGKLKRFRGDLQVTMPEVTVLGDEEEPGNHRRLTPIYPATSALPSFRLAQWIEAALDDLPPLPDHLPASLKDEYDLVDLDFAFQQLHHPDDRASADAATHRLKFDELFTLQVGLQWRRVRLEAEVAGKDNSPVAGRFAARFLEHLPFDPTGAQHRAFDRIAADLKRDRPMHRLLQGDVGSGKTLVAVWTMLCAVDNDRQAALMAPTEVLAEQHLRTLTDLLAPLGVNVLDGLRIEALTSSTPTSERRRILGELLSGDVDVIIGTHALLEEGVRFADLGVVVIDEQHRFGVGQRVRLRQKGEEAGGGPDVLVMTATPIPRSLALTLYGDLDVTVLDELPPGRKPIVTQLITPREAARRQGLYGFVREQAQRGLQTYVVCPLVEGSEAIEAASAEQTHRRLAEEVWPDLEVGLVHGRMRSDVKEGVMSAFRRGEIHVLVATTVIEVGVDVAAASVMVIEDAERFGISQLHQLRGRVGRGAEKSYCVLFAGWNAPLTDEAVRRLEAVTATTDGFELAEVDLEIRGEGQLFGERQSGLPDLKLARLTRDRKLIEQTREAARTLVEADPDLDERTNHALRAEVVRRYRGGLEELEALATG
ncbi:MAG: ATP-dependent DNA helicase RecG [Actinobacteria bacterium]|nr:ATP-dependent DNA helicase RecG [Actinomycetota bacterium]